MNSQPTSASPNMDDELVALNKIRDMVSACIQCGTCSASCPNAMQMDLTPRKMWRLVIMGRLSDVMASRTFILCSDCYTCTLRCPRGLPLTAAMEALKGLAFARQEARHRSSRLFYETFMETVRHRGRLREMAFMTRYFTAMKSPLAPFRFAPLGLKLMGKGKVEMGFGRSAEKSLDALFEKVAALERKPDESPGKEGHR